MAEGQETVTVTNTNYLPHADFIVILFHFKNIVFVKPAAFTTLSEKKNFYLR